MKKLIASFLLSACAGAPALAQTPFYVGGELGDEYIGVLGGYQIDKVFSIEAHYYDFDKESIPFGSVDMYALGVAGVATVPVKLKGVPQFSVFGSVGVDYAKAKVRSDIFGTTERYTDSDTDIVASAGLQYDFNKNFNARLGLHFNGQADSLFLNAIYKF